MNGLEKLKQLLQQTRIAKADPMLDDEINDEFLDDEEDELLEDEPELEEVYDTDEDDEDDEELAEEEAASFAKAVVGQAQATNEKLDAVIEMQRAMAQAMLDMQGKQSTLSKAVNNLGGAPRLAKSGRRKPKKQLGTPINQSEILSKAVSLAEQNTEMFTAKDVAALSSYALTGDVQAIDQRFSTQQRNAIGLGGQSE